MYKRQDVNDGGMLTLEMFRIGSFDEAPEVAEDEVSDGFSNEAEGWLFDPLLMSLAEEWSCSSFTVILSLLEIDTVCLRLGLESCDELPLFFTSGSTQSHPKVIQLVHGICISASHLTFLERQTVHALLPLGLLYLMVKALGFSRGFCFFFPDLESESSLMLASEPGPGAATFSVSFSISLSWSCSFSTSSSSISSADSCLVKPFPFLPVVDFLDPSDEFVVSIDTEEMRAVTAESCSSVMASDLTLGDMVDSYS